MLPRLISPTIRANTASLNVLNLLLILSFPFCKILTTSAPVGIGEASSITPGAAGATNAGTFGTRLFGACWATVSVATVALIIHKIAPALFIVEGKKPGD